MNDQRPLSLRLRLEVLHHPGLSLFPPCLPKSSRMLGMLAQNKSASLRTGRVTLSC